MKTVATKSHNHHPIANGLFFSFFFLIIVSLSSAPPGLISKGRSTRRPRFNDAASPAARVLYTIYDGGACQSACVRARRGDAAEGS